MYFSLLVKITFKVKVTFIILITGLFTQIIILKLFQHYLSIQHNQYSGGLMWFISEGKPVNKMNSKHK